MIDAIHLNCGRLTDSEHLVFDGKAGMTVFVGPNNSGKSAVLGAIHSSLSITDRKQASALDKIVTLPMSEVDLSKIITGFSEFTEDHPISIRNFIMSKKDVIEYNSRSHILRPTSGRGSMSALREMATLWMDGKARLGSGPIDFARDV